MESAILKSLSISSIVGVLAAGTGCSHINVNEMTYKVLSQEDCRINELEDFCSRNFAKEYREYELLRRNFIQSQEQTEWRVTNEDAEVTEDEPDNTLDTISLFLDAAKVTLDETNLISATEP